MNWITICLFERLGWAKKIKLPDLERPPVELKQAA
jgi:fatty-acid desaturase